MLLSTASQGYAPVTKCYVTTRVVYDFYDMTLATE